jgi:hypothetical protein
MPDEAVNSLRFNYAQPATTPCVKILSAAIRQAGTISALDAIIVPSRCARHLIPIVTKRERFLAAQVVELPNEI